MEDIASCSQCALRNVAQVVVRFRSGAGSMPWPLSTLPTVWSDTRCPTLASASAIRSYPQVGFSLANRRIKSTIAWQSTGLPTVAASTFRPRILPGTAKRRRWSSLSRSRFLPSFSLSTWFSVTEVFDPLLLSVVDPAGENGGEELPRLQKATHKAPAYAFGNRRRWPVSPLREPK